MILQGKSVTVLGTASPPGSIKVSLVLFLSHFHKLKTGEKRAKLVCDVDGKYGKNIGFSYWSLNLPGTVFKG